MLALLLLPQPAAAELEVEPSNLSTELISGSRYSFPLNVQWNGEKERTVKLRLAISAEDTNTDGIRVSLSQDTLNLLPGEERKVELQIDTSYGLEPDNFTMKLEGKINRSELGNPGGKKQQGSDNSNSGGGGGFSTSTSNDDGSKGLSLESEGSRQNGSDKNDFEPDSGSQPREHDNSSSTSKGEFTEHPSTGFTALGVLAVVFLGLVILKI